jgi:hypothetical protein
VLLVHAKDSEISDGRDKRGDETSLDKLQLLLENLL